MEPAVPVSSLSHDRERKIPRSLWIVITSLLFLIILGFAAWLRLQGITAKGISAYDSTDVWLRTCQRLEGMPLTGPARYQPIPDYLYVLGMSLIGKKDFAPLVVNVLFDILNTATLFFVSFKLLRNRFAALACMALYGTLMGSVNLSREAMTHPVAVFFVLLTFWAFILYSEEVDKGRCRLASLWLAISGCLAATALACHVSTQFMCVAYVVLIAMKVFSLHDTPFLKKANRFLLHASVFSISVFAITGLIIANEMVLRSPRVLLDEIAALSSVRTDSNAKHVMEAHYVPRVSATKIRPTMSSATLDHLVLGPECLANGTPARDRLTTLWYGDNAYSVMFLLNIPLMIQLTGRIRRRSFSGHAIYVLSFFYALGLYATYTAFYTQHSRYLIHLMPFLTVNLFLWPLFWAREFLPKRVEFVVVLVVATAALMSQRIVMPGDADILEPTPARTVVDALHECGANPNQRMMVAHPEFSLGGVSEPTLQTVYNHEDILRRFPKLERLKNPSVYFMEEGIRYVLTDEAGIEGVLKRKDIQTDPALEQTLRAFFAHLTPMTLHTTNLKAIRGVIYKINMDGT